MRSSARAWAVIVAAGRGQRFGADVPKQFAPLAGVPMVLWALEPFLTHPSIRGVSLVVPAESAAQPPQWLARLASAGVHVVAGGAERTDSVRLGLATVAPEADVVAVHDGVRPLVSASVITRVLERAGPGRGAVAGRRVTDSLKEVDERGRVVRAVARDRLWRAETPQAFPRDLLIDVYRRAEADGVRDSDSAALCQRYGVEIEVVEIEEPNPKITQPQELELAEAWLCRVKRASPLESLGE